MFVEIECEQFNHAECYAIYMDILSHCSYALILQVLPILHSDLIYSMGDVFQIFKFFLAASLDSICIPA